MATVERHGSVVLILDSGIDIDHPDLAPSYVDTCVESGPDDTFGHGTAIAGIVAALNNTAQVVGTAPGAAVWSIKVGVTAPVPAAVACGIWIGRIGGADVINVSASLTPSTALTDQINMAYAEGILVVASAGNTSEGAVTYPATLNAVIAVSAVDTTNAFASMSSVGSKVELAAPGATVTNLRGLKTTCISGDVCSTIASQPIQGTSFAAPHVAAAAAILRTANFAWSHEEVRRRLRDGATDLGAYGKDNYFGYGLVNITGAIDADPVDPPFFPPSPTVTITGVSGIQASQPCQWFAQVSSGTPPYTYAWRVNGKPEGDGSNELNFTNTGTSFTISVKVTDQLGIYDFDEHVVTVQSGHYCL